MITGFKFFEIYEAVNLHFKKDYDYFKYGGEVRWITETAFLKRKDKYFFQNHASKLKEDNEAIGYCVSNFVAGKKYIRSFDRKTYNDWIEKYNRLEYTFYEELTKYLRLKKSHDGDKLLLLAELHHAGELSSEFLILFDYIMSGEIYKELDKKQDFLWQETKKNLVRYSPFLIFLWNIDRDVLNTLRNAAIRANSNEYENVVDNPVLSATIT